ASQFDTLEILEPQENGFEVKVDQTEQFILAEICSRLDD
ncbi:MAG TPA: gluconate kinase, partial [Opitutae bacterium]|nr:gluconate kinase [Opitutae bacterium]